MENSGPYGIKIDGANYEHDQLRKDLDYEKVKIGCIEKISCCTDFNLKSTILTTIPITSWITHYKWKRDFIFDVIAGITVAIMHIPQGMAYALLANVTPIVGIYMAFFPVLIYLFLGTSRHNSMGTFAVVSLMVGKTVLEHSHHSFFSKQAETNVTNEDLHIISVHENYSPIEVATALTFTVALFQLAMYVLRLGVCSALLSETLISGFTTGAAFHVLISQIQDLLGLDIPHHKGLFIIIKTMQSVFEEISHVNLAALTVSAITLGISVLNNEVLKPIIDARKSSFSVPIELIAIVFGTLISKYCNLEEAYDIQIVGHIPKGLPVPTAPPFSLITSILLDSFSIAIVSYTISLSMALMFAQKLNYEVDANQELLAQGAGNAFASFFSCMPFTACLSRSTIQQTVGGKTQIASLVSCAILLVVLLWIGPFFEPLPKCVLASVIVVALKELLVQVVDFYKFWKLSKLDAVVWMATFITVVIVSIDIGLLVGGVMSLATIFALSFKPYTCLLGSVPCTDIYMDISRYKGAVELPGIKIFHYRGGLNFGTRNIFKNELYRLVAINPQKDIVYRQKLAKLIDMVDNKLIDFSNDRITKLNNKVNRKLKCLILDFSSLSYVDPSGVSTLQLITESFQKIGIPVFIAACSDPIYEMITKCMLTSSSESCVRLFPTLHGAVKCALEVFSSSVSTVDAQL